MYNFFRTICERVLRIPAQPEPPPGDETQTRIFRAAPNYYKYLLVLWALKMALSLLVIAFILFGPLVAAFTSRAHLSDWVKTLILIGECFGLLTTICGSMFTLAMVRLDFEKRWYLLTDRSLRVREGVIFVREATVTFANIQHISISQGPIQRLLDIADLRVDTAGGGGGGGGSHGEHATPDMHTVRFRGVNNANEIKELMQQRLRQLKDSGLGDHEEMVARPSATISPNIVAALREVRAEAAALREVVSRQAS